MEVGVRAAQSNVARLFISRLRFPPLKILEVVPDVDHIVKEGDEYRAIPRQSRN